MAKPSIGHPFSDPFHRAHQPCPQPTKQQNALGKPPLPSLAISQALPTSRLLPWSVPLPGTTDLWFLLLPTRFPLPRGPHSAQGASLARLTHRCLSQTHFPQVSLHALVAGPATMATQFLDDSALHRGTLVPRDSGRVTLSWSVVTFTWSLKLNVTE